VRGDASFERFERYFDRSTSECQLELVGVSEDAIDSRIWAKVGRGGGYGVKGKRTCWEYSPTGVENSPGVTVCPGHLGSS
jgi:hypothetical protein